MDTVVGLLVAKVAELWTAWGPLGRNQNSPFDKWVLLLFLTLQDLHGVPIYHKLANEFGFHINWVDIPNTPNTKPNWQLFSKIIIFSLESLWGSHWWKERLPKKTKNRLLLKLLSTSLDETKCWDLVCLKRGFEVCIKRRDGFDGRDYHMKMAPESSPPPASLHNWRQWYLQACFNFIGVDFLKIKNIEKEFCVVDSIH